MGRFALPGDKLYDKGTQGLGGWLGAIAGGVILLVTLIVLWLDLGMTPIFLQAQAEASSMTLDTGFQWAIPWAFSLATTGLLYALFQFPKASKRYILYIAWGLAIIDTIVDVGGFNAWLLDDPTAALNITLPDDSPDMYRFFDLVVAVICFLNEPLLALLLGKYEEEIGDETYE